MNQIEGGVSGADEDGNGTISRNPLGISIEPKYGRVIINGSTSVNVPLVINESAVECPENLTECEQILDKLSAVFIFEAVNCSALNLDNMETECDVIYPSSYTIIVGRTGSGGGGGPQAEERCSVRGVGRVRGPRH